MLLNKKKKQQEHVCASVVYPITTLICKFIYHYGTPLQYSCLENSKNRGAWWATVHEVIESDTTEAT